MALHAKAKAEADYRFYALYDKISREDVLAHAYAQCRSHKGAPSVDGHSPGHLCRRPGDPVPEGQRRSGAASPARNHGQAEADSERGKDTHLQGPGRGVRLLGL